ncbi:basic proline-rich protein-like [Gymnodraco acuticeps]|uniref:Basic proline-rich protein-like n=1 Tax=Gymnodraco acuticeps TaxID=8218 RepID=A0A6P8VTU5_GYMAC|nr:basic proline-rich protein-like [Gymnodraco acuticeps]
MTGSLRLSITEVTHEAASGQSRYIRRLPCFVLSVANIWRQFKCSVAPVAKIYSFWQNNRVPPDFLQTPDPVLLGVPSTPAPPGFLPTPYPVLLEVPPTPAPPNFLPTPDPVLLGVPPTRATPRVLSTLAHVPSRVPSTPVPSGVPPAPALDPSAPAIQLTLEGSHCGVRRPPEMSRRRLLAQPPEFPSRRLRPRAQPPDFSSPCLRPHARPPEFPSPRARHTDFSSHCLRPHAPEFARCGLRPFLNSALPPGRPPETISCSSALPLGCRPRPILWTPSTHPFRSVGLCFCFMDV